MSRLFQISMFHAYVSLNWSLMFYFLWPHVTFPMVCCILVYVGCVRCDLSVSTEAAAVSLPGPAPGRTHWGTGATPLRPGRPAPASHLHWGPPDQNIKHQKIFQSTCLDDKVTSKLYVGRSRMSKLVSCYPIIKCNRFCWTCKIIVPRENK